MSFCIPRAECITHSINLSFLNNKFAILNINTYAIDAACCNSYIATIIEVNTFTDIGCQLIEVPLPFFYRAEFEAFSGTNIPYGPEHTRLGMERNHCYNTGIIPSPRTELFSNNIHFRSKVGLFSEFCLIRIRSSERPA